jgi:hypothetical protein
MYIIKLAKKGREVSMFDVEGVGLNADILARSYDKSG